MLSEAIERIEELARGAYATEIIDLRNSGGPRELMVIDAKGDKKTIPIRNDRKHHLSSLDDLCELTKRVSSKASIWHDAEAIRVCFDDDTRDDSASMPLTKDSRFQAVLDLAKGGKPLNHDQFMRLLRVRLDGAVEVGVVNTFEVLKFATEGESQAGIERQSISKKAIAQAAGVKDIPTSITVSCPVYSEAEIGGQKPVAVRCLIEINAAEQSISIVPIQRDIELAQMAGDRHVNAQLREKLKGCEKNVAGIYQGRP